MKRGSPRRRSLTSLPRLLAEHCGRRHLQHLPPLTVEEIVEWADRFHDRTGEWPHYDSGPIEELPGETWTSINYALGHGTRGLAGPSSLAQLLATARGVRNQRALPPFTVEGILAWADAHQEQLGDWPIRSSGPIRALPGETWSAVDAALCQGMRGLAGASSLARLLAEHRGKRNIKALPPLNLADILELADAHFSRTGAWPEADCGPIGEAVGENWRLIDNALRFGTRGLSGGSSLARLLADQRGKRNRKALPPYSIEQILAWADAHRRRTGQWPSPQSGELVDAPGETWMAVEMALSHGNRGLAGGTTLRTLLAAHRGVRNRAKLPPLNVEQILAWADAHHRQTGGWPAVVSGVIPNSGGETWRTVDKALRSARRGLAGAASLARLLDERRGTRRSNHHTPLSIEEILAWADAHHARTGRWPSSGSGAIYDAPNATWGAVEVALRNGSRGLPGGTSLAKLLDQWRPNARRQVPRRPR